MPQPLFRQWLAWRLKRASDENPDPTKWDDAATAKRKMQRKAERKNKRR